VKGRGIVVLAVVGAIVVAALVAGCGSDSGSNASATTGSSAPLTKAQFVKQANAICLGGLKEKEAAVILNAIWLVLGSDL